MGIGCIDVGHKRNLAGNSEVSSSFFALNIGLSY